MNAWEILGIEPTKDKKEIKKAYARLLKQYHPEVNPEEFKHNPFQLKKIQSFLHLFLK
ncbi:J domain-containing protein [Holdemanella porci]|uniref:J domain-containing protein n=1 Tax=Holdemanella porci TaxID=2652276 RepID=UPI003AEF7475